jgi:hypothetical protein
MARIENPFSIVGKKTRAQELKDFANDISSQADSRLIHELEDEIAEWRFRRPIELLNLAYLNLPFAILFQRHPFKGILYIRPFWNDGRAAPLLPEAKWGYYRHDY